MSYSTSYYVRLYCMGEGEIGNYKVLTCEQDGRFNWLEVYNGPFYSALDVFNVYVEKGYEIA